jgi:hypothetical protein
MAFARVVTFEGVSQEQMDALAAEVNDGERPEGVPATEFLMLHDPEGEKSVAIIFFDNEDDYAQGHAALDAMPAGDTPGQRTSVSKYRVVARMTA